MAAAAEMGHAVTRLALVALALSLPLNALAARYAIIVSGLGGEPEYEQRFREDAKTLQTAAEHVGDDMHVTTLVGPQATREALHRAIASVVEHAAAADQVTLTLIGHGSFDGEEYRFNIPGPDVTATDLAAWLQRLASRQQLVVIATSSSGGAIAKLQHENRIVITATKSGGERNATHFAEYWAKALTSSEADRDKNEWVTVQEAFDYAQRKVADTFKGNAALATEHARMEGMHAESIPLARLGNAKAMPTDAQLNALFTERLRIENDLDAVKNRKSELPEDRYYDELEGVLVTLARTQQKIDARQVALEGAQR
jgi:hypothetical protein